MSDKNTPGTSKLTESAVEADDPTKDAPKKQFIQGFDNVDAYSQVVFIILFSFFGYGHRQLEIVL